VIGKKKPAYVILIKDFQTGKELLMAHIQFKRLWEAIDWISNSNHILRQAGCARWQYIYQVWE